MERADGLAGLGGPAPLPATPGSAPHTPPTHTHHPIPGGADVGKHWGGPGLRRCRPRVQAGARHARQHVHRAACAVQSVWRGRGPDRRTGGHDGRHCQGQRHCRLHARGVHVAAIRKPRQPRGALHNDRPRNLEGHRRHPGLPGGRRGHGGNHHGGGALPAGAQARARAGGRRARRVRGAVGRRARLPPDPGHRGRLCAKSPGRQPAGRGEGGGVGWGGGGQGGARRGVEAAGPPECVPAPPPVPCPHAPPSPIPALPPNSCRSCR